MRAIDIGNAGYLENAAGVIAKMADVLGPITTTFNGYRLIARPGDTTDDVLDDAIAREERHTAKAMRTKRNRKIARRAMIERFHLWSVSTDGLTLRDPEYLRSAFEAAQTLHSEQLMRILRFATRWAGDMEPKLAVGYPLEDIAESTSFTSNLEAVTGQEFGYAVEVLSRCWEHGESLRRWNDVRYAQCEYVPAATKSFAPAIMKVIFAPRPAE